MNVKRVFEIVNNRKICDVYYNNHPVWIQEVQNDIAKVGFMDSNKEMDVNIADLSEQIL